MIQDVLHSLGHHAWLYKEGKERNLFVLETAAKFLGAYRSPCSFLTSAEKIAYIRGYFDAEGGIPSRVSDRLYIQFSQKNCQELTELRQILKDLGIYSGKIHIPSVKVDPEYYRFFISSRSYKAFIQKINSWHPRKKPLLDIRMKI